MQPDEPKIPSPSTDHEDRGRVLILGSLLLVGISACQGTPSSSEGAPDPARSAAPEAPLTQEPAPADGIARVRVVDPGGDPMADVEWWVSGHEELNDGEWTRVFFSGLPQHHWTADDGMIEVPRREGIRFDLHVVAHGYVAAEVHSLEANEVRALVLKPGLDVTGTVLVSEAEGTSPLGGARVELRRPNPRDRWFQRDLRTDEEGRFRFEGLVDPNAKDSSSGWQLVCAERAVDLEWSADGRTLVPVEFELDEAGATHATTVGMTQDEFRERFGER